MRVEEWLQPHRQLLLAVVVVAVLSAGALGLLGWMLVQQDAALERQRQIDRLQQAADRAASAMRGTLADLAARAAQRAGAPSPPAVGLLRANLDAAGVTLRDGGRVLWVPAPVSTTETARAAFADGEALEFGGDLEGALRAYARAARAGGASAAAAVARVARVQRKLGRAEAALATYDRLAARELTPVDGLPSSLVARVGRAGVFEDGNRASALRAEAAALRDDLLLPSSLTSASTWSPPGHAMAERWPSSPVATGPIAHR